MSDMLEEARAGFAQAARQMDAGDSTAAAQGLLFVQAAATMALVVELRALRAALGGRSITEAVGRAIRENR